MFCYNLAKENKAAIEHLKFLCTAFYIQAAFLLNKTFTVRKHVIGNFTCLLKPGHLSRGHILPLAKTHAQDTQLSSLCPYEGRGPAD